MKKLITALMMTALASGAIAMNEGQSFAASTHGSPKARHSLTARKHKPRTKKRAHASKTKTGKKKPIGKVRRVRKSRRKMKPSGPVVNPGNGAPLPITQ